MENKNNAKDRELFLDSEGPQTFGITYVASPYSHPDPRVLEARVRAARIITAGMLREGIPAFSPVSYSDTLVETCGARPRSGWYEFDLHFLQHARKMIILKLPGWEESRGILIEKGFAHARQIPVSHMELGPDHPPPGPGDRRCPPIQP